MLVPLVPRNKWSPGNWKQQKTSRTRRFPLADRSRPGIWLKSYKWKDRSGARKNPKILDETIRPESELGDEARPGTDRNRPVWKKPTERSPSHCLALLQEALRRVFALFVYRTNWKIPEKKLPGPDVEFNTNCVHFQHKYTNGTKWNPVDMNSHPVKMPDKRNIMFELSTRNGLSKTNTTTITQLYSVDEVNKCETNCIIIFANGQVS